MDLAEAQSKNGVALPFLIDNERRPTSTVGNFVAALVGAYLSLIQAR